MLQFHSIFISIIQQDEMRSPALTFRITVVDFQRHSPGAMDLTKAQTSSLFAGLFPLTNPKHCTAFVAANTHAHLHFARARMGSFPSSQTFLLVRVQRKLRFQSGSLNSNKPHNLIKPWLNSCIFGTRGSQGLVA
jgi:hypothetical protein